MKQYLHKLILLAIILLVGHKAQLQNPYDLPMACVGSEQNYWVKGFNGISDFQWKIFTPDGSELSNDYYQLVNRGDSIMIDWSADLQPGIYTFEVVEHSDHGCTGEPYTENIILNKPEISVPIGFVNEFFEICSGNEADLDPGEFQTYLWLESGLETRIYTTSEEGTYEVRLTDDSYNCAFHTIELDVHPLPVANLGPDTAILIGDEITYDVYNPDVNFYEWMHGYTSVNNLEVDPTEITSQYNIIGQIQWQYLAVTVVDVNNCSASDTVEIRTIPFDIQIPSAFAPASSNENVRVWKFPKPYTDQFGVQWNMHQAFQNVEVMVFNRWGKLVWTYKGPNGNWWDGKDLNGKDLPMDSYHYIIRAKTGDDEMVYKGTVTIVR